jgi:hypothetical protein
MEGETLHVTNAGAPVQLNAAACEKPPLEVSVAVIFAEPLLITIIGLESVRAKSSPVPVSAIDCGLPLAASVIEMEAARAPPAVGVNVTLIVHIPPPATDAPQVFVSAKSP